MSDKMQNGQFDAFEEEVHLSDYINVVLRRWKIALLVFLLVFLGVAAYTFTRVPVYEAYATLEVQKNQQGSMLAELGVESDSTLSTEIEVLRSRSLAEKVVRRKNLEWQVVQEPNPFNAVLSHFSAVTKLPGITITLDGPQSYKVTDLSGRLLGAARSGELFQAEGIALQLDFDNGAAGRTMTIERQQLEPVVNELLGSLNVVELGIGSNILRVSSQSSDPNRARDVVNTLTEAYREQSVESKTRQAGKTVEFIGQQLAGLKGVLDRSEQALQEYKLQTGLMTLGSEGGGLVEKLVSLEQEKAEVALKRQRVDYAIAELKRAINEGRTFTSPTIEGVPQIAEAANRLAELEAERKSLLVDFTPAHPAVIEVQSNIRRVQEAMLSTYQSLRQELEFEKRDLAKTIAGFDEKLEEVPEAELELAKRTRVHKVNAELYNFLLQKQQEASIAEASTISSVEIIDPALTPKQPIKPNKEKNLALGLILGVMLGIGMVFLLDYMDQTIKTSDDVKDKLGLNVFGIIPRIPFADEDAKLPRKRLVTTLAPKAPVVEAFRALRTNLSYTIAKQTHTVIMVTSSLPGEGKSTIAGNLAVVISQTGAKVLLLGCDLRRPSLYGMFDISHQPGLVDLLIDKNLDGLHHINQPRLDVLPSGTIPPNPAEILDSDRFSQFVNLSRERYDYVIIDAPPVLPVTDTQILAPLVDLCLVTLEPCRVPEKAAKQMVENLKAVDAKIAGVVLNDKSGRGFKYYGSYGYYGNKQYGGYYGETDHDKPRGVLVRGMKAVWQKLNS